MELQDTHFISLKNDSRKGRCSKNMGTIDFSFGHFKEGCTFVRWQTISHNLPWSVQVVASWEKCCSINTQIWYQNPCTGPFGWKHPAELLVTYFSRGVNGFWHRYQFGKKSGLLFRNWRVNVESARNWNRKGKKGAVAKTLRTISGQGTSRNKFCQNIKSTGASGIFEHKETLLLQS